MNDVALPSIIEFSEDVATTEAPPPLPAGAYTGEVTQAKIAQSKKGTLYLETHFHIGSDQYPVDFQGGNPDGTTVIHRRVSLEDNQQSRYGLKQFVNALGVPVNKSFDPGALLGTRAKLQVVGDTYEGVTRPAIAKVEPAE